MGLKAFKAQQVLIDTDYLIIQQSAEHATVFWTTSISLTWTWAKIIVFINSRKFETEGELLFSLVW